jgi:hypothetical protein
MHCPDQAAELQQCVPIAAVAGQPRGLDRDHGADPALADGGEQLLEAWPGHAGTGAAEIVIDHLNGLPPQHSGAIDLSGESLRRRRAPEPAAA